MPLNRRAFLGSVAASVMVLKTDGDAEAASPIAAPKPGSASEAKDVLGKTDRLIEARPGAIRLLAKPAGETPVWTYDAAVPGPLLRLKKGAELRVRLVNKLQQPTTLCWHGVRLPNAMDGVGGLTQAPVMPGASFDYRFTPPDSGLFWYHPHVWPYSAEQIDRGLYGVLIVDEPDPPSADEELLVVLDDWALDDHGHIRDFDVEDARGAGRIGGLLTVNGAPAPHRATMRPGSRLRLRLASVVDARIMIVRFEGVRPMVQAIDGQPCEIFQPVRETIPVGPGARFDIMLDLPAEAGQDVKLILRGDNVPDRDLLAFRTAGERRPARAPIAALPKNEALPAEIHLERALKMNLVIEGGGPATPPGASTKTIARKATAEKTAAEKADTEKPKADLSKARSNVVSEAAVTGMAAAAEPQLQAIWSINGVASNGFSGKPLFTVKRGAPVSLALVNKSAYAQQIHIHGHVMRLLHDLDDGWEPYWRDAVLVAAERTKHIAFVADNPGKWALESLILDRQVTGLAAWFEVT